jgi:molybdopterin synthase catalytic subunit
VTADRVLFARIAGGAIRVEDCADAVRADDAGAVVTFEGVVRDHDDGKGVLWLDYSAHPAARQAIRQVALDVSARYPEVRIAVEHRIGRLGIGDVALTCAVSSAHRADAFAACGLLVDEVKQRVPIWKQQAFDDGTSEWVASLG